MALFVWRLQRVLDIREKQESALRSELMLLSERITSIQNQIAGIRVRIQEMLEKISRKEPGRRIVAQQMFMKFAEFSEQEIKRLENEIAKVQKMQKEKTEYIRQKRIEIKSLEKLKEKAKQEFVKKTNKLEQAETEQYTNMKYTVKAG